MLAVLIVGAVSWNFASVYSLQLASSGYGYNITAFRVELDAQRQLNAQFQTTIQTLQVYNAAADQRLTSMRQDFENQRTAEFGSLQEIRKKIDDVGNLLNQLLIRIGPAKR